ncbi:DUF3995 domain-containing protein [Actinomycetota bacterium]
MPIAAPDDPSPAAHRSGAHAALLLAALAGTLHGLASLYWAAGGDWLLSTLGPDLVDRFADMRWVLAPIGMVKVGFALAPVLLARRGWPGGRFSRLMCWLGAAVLTAWGGLNTLAANLVLAGAIRPDGGYDRDGMIGHALLWDPLFLVWGVALAVGLWLTRSSHRRAQNA